YFTQQSPPDTCGLDTGLLCLLYQGSPTPTDRALLSHVYNSYNFDHQLDNLAVISGLKKSDWWGLVAVIESHFRLVHNCEPNQCFSHCQQYLIDRILASANFSNAEWKGVELKRYILTSLVRDVLEVMSTTGLHGHGLHHDVTQLTTGDDQDEVSVRSQLLEPQLRPVGNVVIQINLVTGQDNKRVGPPIFVNQPESYRLDALLANARCQLTSSLQLDQQQTLDLSTALTFPVKVWMPDGLLPVNDEEEWQIALMTLLDTEWVDKQIKAEDGRFAPGYSSFEVEAQSTSEHGPVYFKTASDEPITAFKSEQYVTTLDLCGQLLQKQISHILLRNAADQLSEDSEM
ncbi:hypothetical protein KEM54_001940, partial [Ascosphaera aggregata]